MNMDMVLTSIQCMFCTHIVCCYTCMHRSLTSSLHGSARPIAVLDVQLPRSVVDVNVVPDKRTVMMQCEGEVVTAMEQVGDVGQGCWLLCLITFVSKTDDHLCKKPDKCTVMMQCEGEVVTAMEQVGVGDRMFLEMCLMCSCHAQWWM